MKRPSKIKSLCVFGVMAFNMGCISFAHGVLWTGPTGGNTWTPSFSYPETWDERILVGNSSLSVTGLGVFDYGNDGLAASHPIGLWDGSGNLLGSITVSSETSAALVGDYRYADLSSPIILSPNTYYYLGASYGVNNSDPIVYNGTATLNPAFTSFSGVYYGGFPILSFPEASASWPVQAASLQVTTAPKPSIFTLIGLGLVGLTYHWSRHRLLLPARFRGWHRGSGGTRLLAVDMAVSSVR